MQKFENFKFKEIFEHIMQGKRLKISDHIIGNTPFVMAGYVNSGICDYISNSEARRFPTNSITIDIFGNCFYRSYEFAAGDDVGVFWSDKEINSKAMMYICAVIGKSLSSKFDFGNKLRASQTYDFEIPLPVIKNKEIDFYFMENYITSIEAKMQKLILYHSVLTLRERESRGDFNLIFSKDSSISNFIKEAIMQIAASLFGKLGVEWGEFRLVDLFKILLAKGDLQAKKLEVGDNILISSGNFNNGVVAYVQDCDEFSEKFGSNSLTIDMFGKCFYQPKPFYAVSHGRVN
ncbi:restriction endonuclease subunit S, partial [Campylobacter concisus]